MEGRVDRVVNWIEIGWEISMVFWRRDIVVGCRDLIIG